MATLFAESAILLVKDIFSTAGAVLSVKVQLNPPINGRAAEPPQFDT